MTAFSTKKTRLRVRAITRAAKIKHIQFQPVIKKVDVAKIKEEFAANLAKSKAEKPKAAEPKANLEAEVKEVKTPKAKAEKAAPKAEAATEKKPAAKKEKKEDKSE